MLSQITTPLIKKITNATYKITVGLQEVCHLSQPSLKIISTKSMLNFCHPLGGKDFVVACCCFVLMQDRKMPMNWKT